MANSQISTIIGAIAGTQWSPRAGNATLMTPELMQALVDHAAGNYRLLMTMAGELLAHGMAREVSQLDEKLYLELFHAPRTPARKKVRA